VSTLAVIGGSGAYQLLAEGLSVSETIGPRSTPFGDSAPVHRVSLGGHDALFMSRHGEHGYTRTARFVNYRANVYALRDLGVERVIAWSGPGAIDASLEIGQYVVPDDALDETHARDDTFFTGGGLGFVRQSPVFCPTLRRAALRACEAVAGSVRDGATYACTEGPRLETPAEIRKLRALGAHLVGMTLCPEVFLAKELAMCYAAVCYVTNYAEGIVERPLRPGVLFEGLATEDELARVDATVRGFPAVMVALVGELGAGRRSADEGCSCGHLMDRYIRRGTIGEDWREWVGR
jgi:5'-methylthioadenosine phosphorylase